MCNLNVQVCRGKCDFHFTLKLDLKKKKIKREFRAFSKAVISPCFSASGLSGKHESWGTRKAKAKVGSDESG